MVAITRRLQWSISILLLLVVACAPVETEPEAELGQSDTSNETPTLVAAYPALIPVTATLPPYPWPTNPPWPTEPPEPTEEPTETIPPAPTQSPTPVVTPIPTAAPPIIPFPDGTTPQPFTLFWRDGDVIRSLGSEGDEEPSIFLDPAAEFSLYLPPEGSQGVAWSGLGWGTVSPDGRTLALVLTEEANPVASEGVPYPAHIYLLDRESSEIRLLVKYGADPVWSPDGKRVAYQSLETIGLWVADVANAKASEVYPVDRANGHSLAGYTWSPDNQHLVLVDQVIAQSTDLVVVDAEQLEPPRALIKESLYLLGGPQWSPTTDSIAFVWSAGEGGEGPHLWLISSDGSERKQLTHNVRVLGELSLWSPNGEWIAFGGAIQYERLFPTLDLLLVNSVSSELKRVTFSQIDTAMQFGVNALNPLWTPDGTQIVFVRVPPQEELAEIWVLSLIDGSERKLMEIPNVFDVGLTVGP